MRSTLLTILLMLLTSACASAAGKAPSCSGARRPANPNGSVLAAPATATNGSTGAIPQPSASPCAGAMR